MVCPLLRRPNGVCRIKVTPYQSVLRWDMSPLAGILSWYVTKQSGQLSLLSSAWWKISIDQRPVVGLCGWEGNCRSGVTLACVTDTVIYLFTYGLSGVINGDEHYACIHVEAWHLSLCLDTYNTVRTMLLVFWRAAPIANPPARMTCNTQAVRLYTGHGSITPLQSQLDYTGFKTQIRLPTLSYVC